MTTTRFTGTVSSYKSEAGYGFVTTATTRYFFLKSALLGNYVPQKGDFVSFSLQSEASDGQPALYRLTLERRAVRLHSKRVHCPHCRKRAVPILVEEADTPPYTVCASCNGMLDLQTAEPYGKTFFFAVAFLILVPWIFAIFYAFSTHIL